MVSSPVVYLDEALTVAGSGFPAGESVSVFILGVGVPAVFLGFTDADANGSWSMSWDMLSANKVVSGNAGALAAADVLTISAEGSSGSKATIPVMAIAGSAPAPLSAAASLNFRPPVVAQGGTVNVSGAGYQKEGVNLFVITSYINGVPVRESFDRASAGNGGAFSKDVTVDLEPGVYTIEGFGESGTVATAALVVTAGAK